MREVLYIDPQRELWIVETLCDKCLEIGLNAANSTIVVVSPDYSAIIGQIMRHALSADGEICDAINIEVPYPDEEWNDSFAFNAVAALMNEHGAPIKDTLIFVEAGVIRGSNYQRLHELTTRIYPSKRIVTTALYENTGSKFKSDIVGEYYDDSVSDLTFHWERENKHWQAIPCT